MSVVSLGREPVLVNKEQVLSPRVLQTGDKIEVLLEGRTREFFFQAAPHTVGREAREKSVGSPLMPSSIANLRSDAATEAPGGLGAAEDVGRSRKWGRPMWLHRHCRQCSPTSFRRPSPIWFRISSIGF